MHLVALSLTTLLTFTFPPSTPVGTPFVVETSGGSYPCSIIAAKCAVNVLNADLQFTQSACIYPKSAPTARQCYYWTNLIAAPPKIAKRRSVGKH